jgi:hypothetical protein
MVCLVRRTFVTALAVVALWSSLTAHGAAAPNSEQVGAWVAPVDGRVVAPFAPPATRYGRGHLGVDFAARAGTRVRAAGDGIVTFAGSVAGARHVVVAHAGGLRTSYSFVATTTVRRGDAVRAGQIVATSGGTGGTHDGTVLHFGLRAGETYLDPMTLFRPVDLAALVHLAPTHHGPKLAEVGRERRSLLAGLRDLAGSALGAGVRVAKAGIRGAATLTTHAVNSTLPGVVPTINEVASSLTTWLRHRRHCDSDAPAADGTGGSGHRVMVVAGIDSHRRTNGASLDVPFAALGYERGEATYYSYARDGGAYRAADTHAPLMTSARRLGEQLRAMQRREPHREVDLVAHSQGGVVVMAFLAFVYDPADPAYPPLGTVVTLSSPLEGAPLATAGARIARTSSGRTFLAATDRLAAGIGVPTPPTQAPSVRDLAEGSPFMRRLRAAKLPGTVDLTTVGAVADPVVPAVIATRDGAQHSVVATSPFNAHSAVQTDADALRALRAALEHRPVPCEPWQTAVATALVSPGLTEFERGVGTLGQHAGALVDAGS